MVKVSGDARPATQMVGFQLRFQERIRAQLEDAARENGVSLNSEVIRRLEDTLRVGGELGGQRTRRLFVDLAATIGEIEEATGATWHTDAVTFAAVKRALREQLEAAAAPIENGGEVVGILRDLNGKLNGMKFLLETAANPASRSLFGDDDAATSARVNEVIEQAEAEVADLRTRLGVAYRPQREAEARGRQVYRRWRASKRASARRAYGA